MASTDHTALPSFERWVRHADLDALAAFFDEAAPKLLRVAMHVAPDPGEAEDLVQSAFLTLMENRESLDPSEDGVAWLAVVLRRRAIDRMRRAGARPVTDELDLDAILASVEDAAGPAEKRELHAEALRAIDRLKEPYRQPVLLRLRHGASQAEIAHLLDRSPSTIAVQLHRGIKELRRLLPASFAVSLASALPSAGARGLDGVRSLVLERGAAHVAASQVASTSFLVGGMSLMTTKTLVAAGAGVLVTLALLAVLTGARRSAEPDGTSEFAREEAIALADPSGADLEPPPFAVETTRAAEATETAAPDAATYFGVVIDGVSGERIAGATIELFAPAQLSPREAVRRFPALFRVDASGRILSRVGNLLELDPDPEAAKRRPGTLHDYEGRPMLQIPPTWPTLEGLSADTIFEDRPVTVLGVPPEGELPIAQGRSGADGEFDLRAYVGTSSGKCLLQVTAAGHASRTLTAVPGERMVVDLLPARRVAGVAVGPDGSPVSVRLALIGGRGGLANATDREELQRALQHPGGLAVVEVTTDASGAFDAEIGAAQVFAQSLDPRWDVQGWNLTVGGEVGKVFLRRAALFRFLDANDDSPVERISLRVSERENGYVEMSGTYDCPGGLLGSPSGFDFSYLMRNSTLELTAWSPGYAPARLSLPKAIPEEPMELRLERGVAPAATGHVSRGKSPVRGALVELLATSRLSWWRSEEHVLDATRTGTDGRFHLTGPDGPAAVRVETPDGPYVETITLPLERPLQIDLDALGGIHVAVRSSNGAVRADHVVALQGRTTGLDERAYADEDGVARFDRIGPGSYLVMAPAVSTTSSFSGDFTEEVELQRGEERRVEFVVPDPTQSRHLRIDAGADGYSGWRARTGYSEWIEIENDGTVPIDLASATEAWEMRIAAVDGRRWRFHIPATAPDGTVIALGRGSGTLKGVLVDHEGAPLTGVAVLVRTTGTDQDLNDRCVAVTDGTGRFEVTGLRRQTATIALREDPEARSSARDGRIDETRFTLNVPIGSDTWVELEVPKLTERIVVEGAVLDADGTPLDGANVAVVAGIRGTTVTCQPAKSWAMQGLDEDGAFRVEVPRTESVEIAVYPRELGEALLRQTIDVPATSPLAPIEIRLP
ncbi:MAG: sigma-70 family RNA polymerase sigma factor [Planctomycetota bacterium]